MRYALKIKNLNYGILNDINFSLKEGTITCLMGKSGSGKTLLLKLISGIIKIDNNENNYVPIDQTIGLYIENYNLENNTVILNLVQPLINLGIEINEAKRRAYSLATDLNIEDLVYKKIEELSYSQKKIVGFAKSVIHDPKVILLDNIFDSLDLSYKKSIIECLKKLEKHNKSSIVFTTNDSENVLMCDNLMILNDGKLVYFDKCEHAVEHPNLFIKNKLKVPFMIDLSQKLKLYGLIDSIILDHKKMVNTLWK